MSEVMDLSIDDGLREFTIPSFTFLTTKEGTRIVDLSTGSMREPVDGDILIEWAGGKIVYQAHSEAHA